jgi:hypothetical protein
MIRFTVIIFFINFSNNSFAKSIIADLSNDSININTGFNGAEIFLFGTYDGKEGDDLFIFIEGPRTEGKDIRIRGRATKDGATGWITIKNGDGKELVSC